MLMNRKTFLKKLAMLSASTGLVKTALSQSFHSSNMFFQISLAEWSLHKTLFSKTISNLDFPVIAKNDFDIDAIEYVNQFFKDKANDKEYLTELKNRCTDVGVKSLLIMCDGEGELGHGEIEKRKAAVENHYKWVEAAKFLGCHSIRVNAGGAGSRNELAKTAADGLHQLATFAKDFQINVIVENHGGYSSDGEWLSSVINEVGLPNCGTLPDFGNFCIKRDPKTGCADEYDRYKGVRELMPFAKGVSAKSYDFDTEGNCLETDYKKMLSIVKQSGYTGHIGIEYEGNSLSEKDGILATKKLLERIGSTL